ncbi:hypothetical protein HPP92_000060 [Vanilla planifolia]|uniref:Pentatricopeptide repeat-containing protein n=1 Tax=Vanilla planifolia TaxID=51239 RepID=A0A835VC86_VANPL|nr:hypothetical protein HPP92_000060 [Vanilla planifolia]
MAFSTHFRDLVCSNNITTAMIVHCKLIFSGLLPDVINSNHLMSMYAKRGLLHHARCLFDQMPHWNVVSCSILINAYAKIGSPMKAIDCFRSMVSNGLEPNGFPYVGILSACGSLGAVNSSKEIHGRIYRFEHVSNSYLNNSLVNSYSKCGLVSSARKVFDEMRQPNLICWSSMIAGYSHSGEHAEALAIFSWA